MAVLPTSSRGQDAQFSGENWGQYLPRMPTAQCVAALAVWSLGGHLQIVAPCSLSMPKGGTNQFESATKLFGHYLFRDCISHLCPSGG